MVFKEEDGLSSKIIKKIAYALAAPIYLAGTGVVVVALAGYDMRKKNADEKKAAPEKSETKPQYDFKETKNYSGIKIPMNKPFAPETVFHEVDIPATPKIDLPEEPVAKRIWTKTLSAQIGNMLDISTIPPVVHGTKGRQMSVRRRTVTLQ